MPVASTFVRRCELNFRNRAAMRGTIKFRTSDPLGKQVAVFSIPETDVEYPITYSRVGLTIEHLIDAPLEVRGSLKFLHDGTAVLEIEHYRLLFPLQEEFPDYWYEADNAPEQDIQFAGNRY